MFRLILILLLFTMQFVNPQSIFAIDSPEKVSTSATNQALAPAIVTDSNGIVHQVWMDAADGWGSSTTNLLHSFWNGEVWSAPATIATGAFHELPSLAADNKNNIYLTWDADTAPGTFQIYYSTYNGSTWTPAVSISGTDIGDAAWDSEIAIDSSGNPHVAYTFIPADTVGNQRFTYYTRYDGVSWTKPIDITQSGTFHQYPTIAADKAGNVHVGWKSDLNGSFEILDRVWNGASFSTTTSVSGVVPGVEDPQPRITTDQSNNAHIVWDQRIGNTSDYDVEYSKFDGSSWSSLFTVASSAHQSNQGVPSVDVDADSDNNVYATWIDNSTAQYTLGHRKFANSTTTWETSDTNINNATSVDSPAVAIDKFDNLHAVWAEVNDTTSNYEIFSDSVPFAVEKVNTLGDSLTTSNADAITIPPGSLSKETQISVQIAPLSEPSPQDYNAIPRQYIFEPEGTTFTIPINIVFHYTDAEIAGASESTLGVYVWDSQTKTWEFKTGVVDKILNTITITLDHFSRFGILGTQSLLTWIPPLRTNSTNTIKQGRTLPIKFRFSETIPNPNQVKIQIVDSSANLLKEFANISFSQGNQQFIANLSTKDLLKNINYQIKVLYQGLLRGSLDFTLN